MNSFKTLIDITCQIILCQKNYVRKNYFVSKNNCRSTTNTRFTRKKQKEETYPSGSFFKVNLS